jgi:plastocyanin
MTSLRRTYSSPALRHVRRSVPLFGLGGALALLLVLGGLVYWNKSTALAGETREVKIDNYSFSPGTLTVPVGTTVSWTNRDETVHTVVAQDSGHAFKSPGLDTDDKFSFTFDKPGTYVYICTVHPYMTGKIVVQ